VSAIIIACRRSANTEFDNEVTRGILGPAPQALAAHALLKAIEALPRSGPLSNPQGWLFRIAHDAALDFLRRRARLETPHADEDLDMIATPVDPDDPTGRPIYFILLDWSDERVLAIRDFRFARYAVDDAQIQVLR